eukprot:gene2202-2507_t
MDEVNAGESEFAENESQIGSIQDKESNDVHYANTIQEALEIIRKHELQHTLRYSCYQSTKDFGNTDFRGSRHKVHWNNSQTPYNGVPFFILGSKYLQCQHGKDYQAAKKQSRKNKKIKDQGNDHCYRRKYTLVQDTKKFGCPAKIILQEILQFPQYKINDNTEKRRRSASNKIKVAIESQTCIETVRKFVVNIPNSETHANHPIGAVAGISQEIDERLAEKIDKLVREGVSRVNEMKRHLKIFVKTSLFSEDEMPDASNRRFFPRDKVIRNHMVVTTRKLRHSMVDQEYLQEKVTEWKESGTDVKIFFRPRSANHSDADIKQEESDGGDGYDSDESVDVECRGNHRNQLLFIYQNSWQKRLLNRYGNELAMLDATYRTTRYSLPLFFLVVRTNVDYQVVGTFVCESETTESIQEALEIMKKWNPEFKPKHFMTDYSNEEITAIENVFPGCFTLLCDFHREQAWDRWLRKTANGCSQIRTDVLEMLRRIARSQTDEGCTLAEKDLKASPIWKKREYGKLVQYVETYWLPIKKRWVQAYRQDRILVNCNTNNGTERQNEALKYQYLERNTKRSLTRMLMTLIDQFFPDKYDRYCEANMKQSSSYRLHAQSVPEMIRSCPKDFIKHWLEKKDLSDSIPSSHVVMTGYGKFTVQSLSRNTLCQDYEVFFGNEKMLPSCSCYDWKKSPFLCKHFFAIFRVFPVWSWNALSPIYRESPFFQVDELFGCDSAEKDRKIELETESSVEKSVEISAIESDNEVGFNILDGSIHEPNIDQPIDQLQERIPPNCGVLVRETISEIRSLTFLLESQPETLFKLHSDLEQLKEQLYAVCPEEKGLPLLPCTANSTMKNLSKRKLLSLPSRKQKWKYVSRVGEKRDKIEAAKTVEVKSKKDNPVDETIVPNFIDGSESSEIIHADANVIVEDNDTDTDSTDIHGPAPTVESCSVYGSRELKNALSDQP